MRQLIVGGNGFIGKHLVRGLKKRHEADVTTVVQRAGEALDPDMVACDMLDVPAIRALLQNHYPDRVYFLVGSGRMGADEKNEDYFRGNFLTVARFLEAAEPFQKPFQLFFTSTMHVYGNATGEVIESTPIAPVSYYGFTKYLAERALEAFSKRNPQHQIIVGRLYTCIGPGQAEGFVVPDLCKKIRSLGNQGRGLVVRSPSSFRQFMDVRDLADLLPRLWDFAERAPYEVINLASLHSSTIESIAKKLLELSGVKSPLQPVPDPHNPFQGIRVKPEKLRAWVPAFPYRPLDETLRDIWHSGAR